MKHKNDNFYRLMSKTANQQVDCRSAAHVWPYVQVCVTGTGCELLALEKKSHGCRTPVWIGQYIKRCFLSHTVYCFRELFVSEEVWQRVKIAPGLVSAALNHLVLLLYKNRAAPIRSGRQSQKNIYAWV